MTPGCLPATDARKATPRGSPQGEPSSTRKPHSQGSHRLQPRGKPLPKSCSACTAPHLCRGAPVSPRTHPCRAEGVQLWPDRTEPRVQGPHPRERQESSGPPCSLQVCSEPEQAPGPRGPSLLLPTGLCPTEPSPTSQEPGQVAAHCRGASRATDPPGRRTQARVQLCGVLGCAPCGSNSPDSLPVLQKLPKGVWLRGTRRVQPHSLPHPRETCG